MKDWGVEEWGTIVFVGIILTMIAWIVASMFITGQAKAVCLANGYPEVKTTYSFDIYCIKRLDQTDIVTPVNQLKGK